MLRGEKPAVVTGDPGDQDRLGRWVRHHETGDGARDEDRRSRVLLFLLILSICANFILVVAVSNLIPLQHLAPYLVTVGEKGDAVAEVKPLRFGTDQEELLGKSLAMRYVRMRHEILPDFEQMSRRWGKKCLQEQVRPSDTTCGFVHEFSTPAVYADFFRKTDQDAISALIQDGITRRVTIDLEPIELDRNVYEIRFSIEDSKRDERNGEPEVIRRQKWIATVWVAFLQEEKKYDHRFINPLGFRVTKYELARQESRA